MGDTELCMYLFGNNIFWVGCLDLFFNFELTWVLFFIGRVVSVCVFGSVHVNKFFVFTLHTYGWLYTAVLSIANKIFIMNVVFFSLNLAVCLFHWIQAAIVLKRFCFFDRCCCCGRIKFSTHSVCTKYNYKCKELIFWILENCHWEMIGRHF